RYRGDQSDLGAFLPVFAPKVHRAGPVMRDTRPAGLIFIALTASRRFAESHAADPNNDTQQRGNAVMPVELSSRTATAIATIASCLTMALMSSAAIAQPGPGRAFASDPRAEDRTYHFEDTDEDLPYCVFASSKIEAETPAPLIISLHGLGAPPQIMC